MLSAERIALLKHGAPPRNALEAALRNVWYGGGGASYEKTVGPASIISISDAKPKPAKSLIVGMEPIQAGSGDPSPDNIRPITGRTGVTVERTGVNVWDEEWEPGTFDGSGEKAPANDVIRTKNYISVKPSTNYYQKNGGSGTFVGYWYDSEYHYISSVSGSSKTITSPASAAFFRFRMSSGYGTTYNHDISINYPATDTDYHAYTGASFPVTWQSESGTVYGGTVDVVSGVLTVDRAMVEYDGSSDEYWNEYAVGSDHYCCVSYPSNKAIGYQKSICNEYKNINNAFMSADYGVYSDNPNLINTYFRMPNADVNTRSEFLAWIAQHPIQLCYELATPQTYQLTPQQIQMLKGSNTLWSDADDLTLTYIGTTPPNLLGGMLGGGLGGAQEPTEETSEEPTEGDGE